jgi:LmbE family N-acetylglucosaminyl deacetylase
VEQVDFLGLPDGVLEYGVPMRRVITREVGHDRPDVVITTSFRDTWDGDAVLNQADHIATGRATLDAANRWVYPELGLEPWKGVREVWAAGSPQARHGVDITETFDRGAESLRAHAAHLEGLGLADFDPGTVQSSSGPDASPCEPFNAHHRQAADGRSSLVARVGSDVSP